MNNKINESLEEIKRIHGVIRNTNNQTVSLLNTLKIIDLNLKIFSQSLNEATDRSVVGEFSIQIQREIEKMQSIMVVMLVDRPKLAEAMKTLEDELSVI